jgi:hypothetical protein
MKLFLSYHRAHWRPSTHCSGFQNHVTYLNQSTYGWEFHISNLVFQITHLATKTLLLIIESTSALQRGMGEVTFSESESLARVEIPVH